MIVLACVVLGHSGSARTRATGADEVQAPLPSPERIGAPPSVVPRIEPAPMATPEVEPRPLSDQARIVAPPVSKESLMLREGPSAQAVDRELRRLVRAAEAPRAVGSTTSSAQAAWTLGLVYLHGAGVRRDPAMAQRWFEQAARYGREPWASAGLAWCHLDGCTGPPNPQAAARAIELLRPRYPSRADFLQWVLIRRQTPLQVAQPGVNQNQVLELPQRQLLERSAAAGDMHANIELGMDAVSHEHFDQAAQYFRRAGPQSLAAKQNLEQLALRGSSPIKPPAPVPLSPSAAEALASAHKYHRGQGVPANFVEAIRFYQLAAARGSVEAQRMLALISSRPMPGGAFNPGWMQQLAYADVGTVVPTVGVLGSTHFLHREPTPLFDLLPPFWRGQMAQVAR
jgi:TPR repeat protein